MKEPCHITDEVVYNPWDYDCDDDDHPQMYEDQLCRSEEEEIYGIFFED